jgi:sugar lactone lactonase YvrE
MLYQGGKEKNTHTWDGWTCANGIEWSRDTKEVLVIGLHMVGKWEWIF